MNREDIIRMARDAGFEQLGPDIEDWVCFTEELECFFQAAYAAGAAAEREACAMQAWALVLGLTDQDTADIVLRAIRARGQA